MDKVSLVNFLLKITPKKIQSFYNYELNYKMTEKLKFTNLSYSQEGEDLVLNKLFKNKNG